MAHYRTTVHSRHTIEETFDYLAEFSHSTQWDPGVVEAQRLTEAPDRARDQVPGGRVVFG